MITSIGKDVEHLEFASIADGNAKCYNDFGKQFGSFFERQTYNHPMTTLTYFSKRNENIHPHQDLYIVYSSCIHNRHAKP